MKHSVLCCIISIFCILAPAVGFARLSVSPHNLYFVNTKVGEKKFRTIRIYNHGPGQAERLVVQVNRNQNFKVESSCPSYLKAQRSCLAWVYFIPTQRGRHEATVWADSHLGSDFVVVRGRGTDSDP